MKKFLVSMLTGLFLLAQTSAFAATSNLAVNLSANKTISAESQVAGNTVYFTVANDVKDSQGNVEIKANTQASGTVTEVSPMRRIGRSAYITIDKITTESTNGSTVNLKAISIQKKHVMVRSIVLSVLIIPLFLLMHGPEAEIPQGSVVTTYTL